MFAQILRKDRKWQRTHPSSGPTAHLAQYMWAQQGPWINGPTTLHPLMHLRGEKFGISPLSEVGFALLPSLLWVSPVCHYQTVSHRWNASVCSSTIASVCSVSSLDGTPWRPPPSPAPAGARRRERLLLAGAAAPASALVHEAQQLPEPLGQDTVRVASAGGREHRRRPLRAAPPLPRPRLRGGQRRRLGRQLGHGPGVARRMGVGVRVRGLLLRQQRPRRAAGHVDRREVVHPRRPQPRGSRRAARARAALQERPRRGALAKLGERA